MRRQNKQLSEAMIAATKELEIRQLKDGVDHLYDELKKLNARMNLLYDHLDLEIKHQPAVTKLVKKKK